MKILSSIVLFLVIAGAAFGADLKVGTLNCYLLFDPAIDHRGKVDDDNRGSTLHLLSGSGTEQPDIRPHVTGRAASN